MMVLGAIAFMVLVTLGVLMFQEEASRTRMAQLWTRERAVIHALDNATCANIAAITERSERLQMELIRVGAYIDAEGLRLRTLNTRRRVQEQEKQVEEWMG